MYEVPVFLLALLLLNIALTLLSTDHEFQLNFSTVDNKSVYRSSVNQDQWMSLINEIRTVGIMVIVVV